MGRQKRSCENCMYKNNCKECGAEQCKYWRSEWDQKFEPDFAETFKREWEKERRKLMRTGGEG